MKQDKNHSCINNGGAEESVPKDGLLFDHAFMDKRLGFELYKNSVIDTLDRASFEYRYGLFEYGKDIGAGIENVCCVIDSIIEESIVAGKQTGEALAYGTLGIVSNNVFKGYGFPSVVENDEDSNYMTLYSSYFSFLHTSNDVNAKRELCVTFEGTKTFSGRKHIFEELLPKYVSEYEVFSGVIYSTQFDGVMRSLMRAGSLGLSEVFDFISHSVYNGSEAKLFFEVLYNFLSQEIVSNEEVLEEAKEIILEFRKAKTPISSSEALRLSKTITLLKIKGENINVENIKNNSGIYTYIPSLFSSTHGEDSGSVGLVKGFVKTHRPSSIKIADKHKRLIQALLGDFAEYPGVKKWKAKTEIFYNKLLKTGITLKVSQGLKEMRNSFGEKKMDLFLKYIRKSIPNQQGNISLEVHKELMKSYFLIDAILLEIERDVQVADGNIEKTFKSKILKFLLGRGKSESIGPLATQSWMMFMRFPLIGKLLAFIPVMKFIPVLLIAKTSFIYLFYKLVDLGIFTAKQVPFMEKSLRFASVNGRHSIGASPQLQDMLIDRIGDLRDINRSIGDIHSLKRLTGLQAKLDQNLYDANVGEDGSVSITDQDSLDRIMLKNEINTLSQDINKEELSREIVNFKLEYLALLQQTAKDSNRSFSDGYEEE